MAIRRTARPPAFKAIFINCPFDDGFKPILRAMVFTIISSGFHPRCALDATDGADIRVGKIATMIGEWDWGIHDLYAIGSRLAPKGWRRPILPAAEPTSQPILSWRHPATH